MVDLFLVDLFQMLDRMDTVNLVHLIWLDRFGSEIWFSRCGSVDLLNLAWSIHRFGLVDLVHYEQILR